MTRLSSSIENMRDRYDVIVIGSGYGGGVAASRLARAGLRVCVLERGREIRPGDYPDTQVQIVEELQFHDPDGHLGSDTGMFDFHLHKDLSILVGCGLGGTSLINANVAIRAVDGVFDDDRWPEGLRGKGNEILAEYYRRAEAMLGSNPYPDDRPPLPKFEAHRASAEAMGLDWYKLDINVTFEDGENHAGVAQKACIDCGDCVTGCNHLAKNTTLMNYLPDAWNHGAEIFTECSVRHVERVDNGWKVHFEVVGDDRDQADDRARFVTTDIVFLGAGTLGSTEILLRSKQCGLALSDHVGQHLSGNGDILGFSYNDDQAINAIGFGSRTDGSIAPVGPTITSVIDDRAMKDWREGMIIEEGAIPGGLAPFLPEMFSLFAGLVGKDTDHGAWDWIKEKARAAESWTRGAYHGAVHNTETYLGMCHDGSEGTAVLNSDDNLEVEWPGVGYESIFADVNGNMEKATAALGGTYIKDPIWSAPIGDNLISVHPLGGCVMADDASKGVTNEWGQVFAGTAGTEVHDGLYVADGSIVPLSIGANPLLTISALTERIVEHLAAERGLALDVETRSTAAMRPATAPGPGDDTGADHDAT